MKYYVKTIATLAVAAIFAACSEDDDPAKVPEQAVISGAAANECPEVTVTLTAKAEGAQSYRWYRGTYLIKDSTASTYTALSTGTYYAVGVSSAGEGEKSEGKEVTIQPSCPPPTPNLTGPTRNTCPGLTVRLTAEAENVEAYTWYKDGAAIAGATKYFYDVTESGEYTVGASNSFGASAKSEARNVTISECPPPPPVISSPNATGDNSAANVCPEKTVQLVATSEGATSYQWYRYGELIPNATSSTYTATTTGGYYAVAKNGLGESERTPAAYIVYIDLCDADFRYSHLLGTYNVSGTPSLLETSGPSAWTSTISQPEDGTTLSYVVTPFADFRTGDETTPLQPIYITVGRSDDSSTIALAVDTRRALGTEDAVESATGEMKTYTAYFEAFFIGYSDGKRYVFWFNTQYYQAFWDAATKTLDFSGVYNHEGVDYDIQVAVLARTDIENKRWEGAFTDGYKHCKFVQGSALGAPSAFTGERVALPRLGRAGSTPPLKSVTIDFDPAKFSRKR